MQAGISAGVPFEEACGGNAECCTCHLYVPIEDIIKDEDHLMGEGYYQKP